MSHGAVHLPDIGLFYIHLKAVMLHMEYIHTYTTRVLHLEWTVSILFLSTSSTQISYNTKAMKKLSNRGRYKGAKKTAPSAALWSALRDPPLLIKMHSNLSDKLFSMSLSISCPENTLHFCLSLWRTGPRLAALRPSQLSWRAGAQLWRCRC